MLTLSNVSKSYGSSPPVLDRINLVIDKGEFVSLIGPSGCGKSTLLKLISGLTSPSSGSILVDDMTPVQPARPSLTSFRTRLFCPGARSAGMLGSAWSWSK
jgi:ABC-type sugar transport system ATPase subunit